MATAAPTAPAPLPHGRAGSGQPLVLLNGALVDRDYWQTQLEALAVGHDVIACDLPGHGEAPPLSEPVSVADMARAVLATLDALALPAASVLGHSLGGMVAQELALIAPERVRALILADTWCRPRGYLLEPIPFRTAYLHWALRTFPVGQMVEMMAAGVAWRTPAIAPYARRVMGRYAGDREAYLHIWDAATDFDSHDRLGLIACPTLVVASDSYPFTEFQSRKLAEGIADARLAVIPDTGHWVSWDNPAAFEAAITEFLGAIDL
ncbi:MAG: alpha/beta fold hydrolase [Chloroflexales bacterium]|nr:alpha/beta fold hydrolase [Chloroflexales bacterium]